jgi:mycothiol synthase
VTMSGFVTKPCRQEERAEALRILFSHLPRAERDRNVAQMLDGRIDLAGLLGCYEFDRMVGAMLSVESPGRLLIIWPPRFRATVSQEQRLPIASVLAVAARQFAVDRDVRLAQALLEPDDLTLDPAFLAAGFFGLSRLFYLERKVERTMPLVDPSFEFVSYNDQLHGTLVTLVEETFEGSQDCPEVNGKRTAEEMLAGHRAQGEFDPDRWLLVRQNAAWAGCVLLTGLSDVQALEITYLGVSPNFRGRGIGQQLVRKALWIAQAAGFPTVTLAVDSRNQPALRIYKSEGFEVWDERHAYLLILDGQTESIEPPMNANGRR